MVQELIQTVKATTGSAELLPDLGHVALIPNGDVVAIPGRLLAAGRRRREQEGQREHANHTAEVAPKALALLHSLALPAVPGRHPCRLRPATTEPYRAGLRPQTLVAATAGFAARSGPGPGFVRPR